jgi:excisionase family DNA binding protein
MTAVLLTVEDAAQALALGRTKVYELLDAGQLRSVKIGRARRIPLEALHEFVRSIEEPSPVPEVDDAA